MLLSISLHTNKDINKLEELSNHVRGLKIEDKKVINPNNKIELINTKIITYIQ